MSDRLNRLIYVAQQAGLDALALVPGASLRYLTGLDIHAYERVTVLLVPSNGRPPALVLPRLEAERAQATLAATLGSADACALFPWDDAAGPAAATAQAVTHAFAAPVGHAPRVAVEYLAMRLLELRALETACPGVQTVDATPLLAELRMRKDAHELAAMTEAVRIIEAALHAILLHIQPGVTEQQLSARWTDAIRAAGGAGESFGNIVASGPNSANPHHSNSARPFQAGDLILLDGGAYYQGYASDITRTVALGEPGPEARQIYALVQAANAAGRAALRPGVTGDEIDRATRQVIEAGGYGAQFVHRTGHGLGSEPHEPPSIVAGNHTALACDTTFTIEPGIYVTGLGGVRIEDDVVITSEGGRSLTSFTRELLVLPT